MPSFLYTGAYLHAYWSSSTVPKGKSVRLKTICSIFGSSAVYNISPKSSKECTIMISWRCKIELLFDKVANLESSSSDYILWKYSYTELNQHSELMCTKSSASQSRTRDTCLSQQGAPTQEESCQDSCQNQQVNHGHKEIC